MTTDPKPPRPRPHTLADHLLGALAGHTHDGEADHDHDDMEGLLTHGASDRVALVSVGIDIGSSGTQLAFARLDLERREEAGAGRLAAARRETIYQSPVFLTPYRADGRIDEGIIGRLVNQAFASARLSADDIDCGVVILTGAAHERENAEAITRRLAEECGDIVSAAAGHHMEARLAAFGSGAVELSRTTGRRFLNVDIGGGTTKLAICARGEVVATAAIEIGGRQAVVDSKDRLTRLDPAGARWAERCGLSWRLGEVVPRGEMGHVAERMAQALVATLQGLSPPARGQGSGPVRSLRDRAAARTRSGDGSPEPPPVLDSKTQPSEILLTEPLPDAGHIDGVMLSGGVAEYVYARESRDFCDLGKLLGRALAKRISEGALPFPLMPAAECIRATVLGASSYSVELSGRTGTLSDPAHLLPRRNLPVLRPPLELGESIDARAVSRSIRTHLAAFDRAADGGDFVLAIAWQGSPEYPRVRALADGIAAALGPRIKAREPVYIILDGDIAGTLGAILRDEKGVKGGLVVLDGIALADFDYVDLGRIRLPSGTVPVTIKSLVFREVGDT